MKKPKTKLIPLKVMTRKTPIVAGDYAIFGLFLKWNGEHYLMFSNKDGSAHIYQTRKQARFVKRFILTCMERDIPEGAKIVIRKRKTTKRWFAQWERC